MWALYIYYTCMVGITSHHTHSYVALAVVGVFVTFVDCYEYGGSEEGVGRRWVLHRIGRPIIQINEEYNICKCASCVRDLACV